MLDNCNINGNRAWQELVSKFESRTISSAEFCKLHNISRGSIYKWRKYFLDDQNDFDGSGDFISLSSHIFYNKQYDKLKMLYWHKNGFNLLYKRLEKERFKIPKLVAARCITYEQLLWLFDGLDIDKITGFQPLKYSKYF